jgi:ferredoxin
MNVDTQEMVHFHLTGRRGGDAAANPGPDMCPALLAPYRELASLRYDFPLVLLDSAESQASVDTLTGVINRLLREIAPEGGAGALLRQHVLRLETRMRELSSAGHEGTLTELWKQAEKSLLAGYDEREAESFGNSIATARFALRVDGRIVDCDDRLPALLLQHAWHKREARRARETCEKIETLIIGLRNMLKVDELKSDSSRTPQRLKMTLGRRYREAFDFGLMAEILEGSTLHNRLPAARRNRIRWALAALESQKFFAPEGTGYSFVFDSLSAALKAWHERLTDMADVVQAIEIAELEVGNNYREDKHSPYFERFSAQVLTPADLALFPSYLVCVNEDECTSRDTARLMEIVNCELPVKVLIQVDDVLGKPSQADGQPHKGPYVQQLAHTFVAGNAFVLQSAASGLYRQSEQIRKGLEFGGPAFFSIFAPLGKAGALLPAYLVAAAAHESRAFPAFSYDPAAGRGLADRFDVSGNPDVELDWPLRELQYEDDALQAINEDYAFTPVDFAVIDPLYAEHFELAGRESWNEDMVGVANYLEIPDADTLDKMPFVAVVDSQNMLRRLVVDDILIRIARRCRDRWHALQELGGIHNSYADAALRSAAAGPGCADAPARSVSAASDAESLPAESQIEEPDAAPEAGAGQEPVAASADPWIETPRCTTCDECTKRNPRMFAYDDNKQAYIQDPDAGTYRELVEAAELCQVSIIHPGKPRNPQEPGLAELTARAEPFNA